MKRHKILLVVTLVVLLSAIGAGVVIGMNSGKIEDADAVIKEGETYKVRLEENPSTGYCWLVSNPDYRIVTITGDYFEEIDPAIGAAGIHVWNIQGLEKGTAELTFQYKRPWEQDALETKVITITVE